MRMPSKLCLELVRIFLTVLKTLSQKELLCGIRRNYAKFDRFGKSGVSVTASFINDTSKQY